MLLKLETAGVSHCFEVTKHAVAGSLFEVVGMPCLMHVVRQMSFWYMFVNDQAVCFCFVNLCASFQAWKNISVLVHRHIK